MKMLPKISMFLAMLGLITFVACEKESNNVAVPNTVSETSFFKGVSEKDGMLVFESEAHIQMLTESMLQDRTKTTQQLNEQFPKFRSNRIAYEQFMARTDLETLTAESIKVNNHLICFIKKCDGDKYLQKSIDSYFLSSICNEDGFFQVDSVIYKITYDMVYQYDAQSRVEIKKDKVERSGVGDDSRICDTQNADFICNAGTDRVQAIYCATSWGVYSEAGVSAKSFRRNTSGSFVSLVVPSVNVTGSYTLNRFRLTLLGKKFCSSTSFTANKTATNTDSVEDLGTSCWGCCAALATPTATSIGKVTNGTCTGTATLSF